MSPAELVRRMSEAGAPMEAIVIALEAVEEREALIRASRAGSRDRKRTERQRSRDLFDTGEDTEGETLPLPASLKENPPHPLKKITLHPTPAQIPLIARDFGEFWKAYPHKVGKDAARPAFVQAWLRIGAEPLQIMLVALVNYRQAKPPDRPWCNPATWLNQGRWNDDPGQNPTTRKTRTEAYEANMARAFTGAKGALARERDGR